MTPPLAEPVNVVVILRAAGVSVVIDLTDSRLPSIAHWGADLGEITAGEAESFVGAGTMPVGPNQVDTPVRLSILPEHWTGWMGRPGISGSRGGRDWSPRFTTVAARVEDEAVPVGDTVALVARGAASVEVEAVDEEAGLAVVIRIELTDAGLLRARATLTNEGPELYDLQDLVLALPVPSVANEIADFGGRWGRERTPQRRLLTVGTHLREGRKGRTGADAATLLQLGTPGFSFAEGEVWGVHTAWSGNHTYYAELLSTGQQVVGGGELLLPGEVRLAAGRSYTSPWLYGSYGRGLDEVARRFHRFLRARPQHPSPERPVTLNVWEAVYFDHDLERLLDLAERAAALGVERYVLDDGWFGARRDDQAGLGDWTVSADVWPDGLHPLVDRVRELGMQFGLWFEPEMVNLDSDVARSHPEWVMATDGRLPVESRHQQVINLGIPECYAYIRDAILAILDEYDISYLKWDHNRDLVDAGTSPSGRPGVHEQTLAFYRLVDEIKAAQPTLEIESCSSGGARVDLGVLERTERVWVSDCIDPLERQSIHRWTTQLIPPEMMGAHIASGRSHTTGRVHDLSFRAATAVFGHLGIEWDLAGAGEAELAELAEWVSFFKANRSLLLGGDLFRIDHPDPSVVAHGVVAPDGERAIYSYALVSGSAVLSPGRLRLPGLDPVRRYHVAPVQVGRPASGLRPPSWWSAGPLVPRPRDSDAAHQDVDRSRPVDADGNGMVARGAVLAKAGLMAPLIDPEQAVLILVEAIP